MDTPAYLDMNNLEDLLMPRESKLKEVLKAHRQVFTKWRYGYELLWRWRRQEQNGQSRKGCEFGERRPQMAALKDALKIIVTTYCR